MSAKKANKKTAKTAAPQTPEENVKPASAAQPEPAVVNESKDEKTEDTPVKKAEAPVAKAPKRKVVVNESAQRFLKKHLKNWFDAGEVDKLAETAIRNVLDDKLVSVLKAPDGGHTVVTDHISYGDTEAFKKACIRMRPHLVVSISQLLHGRGFASYV